MKTSCCFLKYSNAVQCATDLHHWMDIKGVVRDQPDKDGYYWLDVDSDTYPGIAFRAIQLWCSGHLFGTIAATFRESSRSVRG